MYNLLRYLNIANLIHDRYDARAGHELFNFKGNIMTIANTIYTNSYLKPFFDAEAQRLRTQIGNDYHSFKVQKGGLGQPHVSFSVYLMLLPAVIKYTAKLLLNLALLLATAILALLALFSDRKIAYQLSLAMMLQTFLVGVNAANAILALVSPIVNGIRSIPMAFINKENCDLAELKALDSQRFQAAYQGIFSDKYLNISSKREPETLEEACSSVTYTLDFGSDD